MTFHIPFEVVWQDELGGTLFRYDGLPITSCLVENASPETKCLCFIDPYGDTTLNASQVFVLQEELATLSNGNGSVAEQANALLSFLQLCEDRTHSYLKFIGY